MISAADLELCVFFCVSMIAQVSTLKSQQHLTFLVVEKKKKTGAG